MVLLFIFSIAHVLGFAALWSAATGYQSPSALSFTMPDLSLVTINDERLRLCWALDLEKLKGFPVNRSVILGPTVKSVFGSVSNLAKSAGELLDIPSGEMPRDIMTESGDFYNIYACEIPRMTPPGLRSRSHIVYLTISQTLGRG